MTRIRAALSRRSALRAHLREERALARAQAFAPTVESAHEIAVLTARR
ncbi:hypothetical protein [Blastococcus saxobsidens]|uniref:Uncharacterized protein n=1 Tax=Blastococcus saxobsidens TaxID=138336 RepID=A0A4Q7Y5L0_9ACTN|nr:hypothetical protein [Blastococcus saxobsidens]RZU31918.1 hypothetical protein BKA19_1603 [Blastococcus saxobsidens]